MRFRFLALALGALLMVGAAEPPKKVRLLVVVDASEPLAVDYRTTAKRVRQTVMAALMPGILPVLIENRVDSKQFQEDSKKLQTTVGALDRRPILEAGILAALRTNAAFDPATPAQPAVYGSWKHLDLKKAQAAGYPFVLAIKETFAGMITAWEMETLSASSMAEYELFDTATGDKLGDGKARAFAQEKHSFEEGTNNRVRFITEWAGPVGLVCGNIYGDLNKHDLLHKMAERSGLGEQVPAVGSVLSKYENRFDYSFRLPENWHSVKGASKYATTIEPDTPDKAKMGVAFSIDLLVPELGQDVKTIDEYAGIALDRMKKAGYATDESQPFDALSLKQPHVALVMDRPNRSGKEAIVMRQAGARVVAVYNIVFLSDYDEMLKKYKSDLESVINGASITTR